MKPQIEFSQRMLQPTRYPSQHRNNHIVDSDVVPLHSISALEKGIKNDIAFRESTKEQKSESEFDTSLLSCSEESTKFLLCLSLCHEIRSRITDFGQYRSSDWNSKFQIKVLDLSEDLQCMHT